MAILTIATLVCVGVLSRESLLQWYLMVVAFITVLL